MAVEAASKQDQEKLGVALQKLAGEDPSFSVSTIRKSGQTIIKGMGELHLDIKIDILRRAPYNINVTVGAPQVAYRETIRKATEIDYTHKKQTGGTGPVRARQVRHRAERERRRVLVREQDHRRRRAEGILPGRREGPQLGDDLRPARRLPGRRREGPADRRRLSRGGLVGDRLRDRVAGGAS
jgi:translation elongation factor EF-G